MVLKCKEATNTMMVDLLAKFGVDACKTSLEFISPPPVITFFLSGFIENLKKSLLIRMDLNKKSGIIQFFTTKIEENANWTFKTLLLTCQKLIWHDWWHVIISFEIFEYNILTFWSKFKIGNLISRKFHQSSYKVNFRCKVSPQIWEICASH